MRNAAQVDLSLLGTMLGALLPPALMLKHLRVPGRLLVRLEPSFLESAKFL